MYEYSKFKKSKIRAKFLSLRKKISFISAIESSIDIFFKIKKLSLYKKAKVIMFYVSSGFEVITDFMIKLSIKEGKNIVVPIIVNSTNKQMLSIKITKFEDLLKSVYGIRQPKMDFNNIIEKDCIDLIFVPGVVFDLFGYRMGYGKGYYDRWLRDIPISKTIGLAYSFQIINKLPIDKHDVPIGMIITEKKVIIRK
ncbi:MAG: 5-formyltetrahydrofolate cyclo-ligase [Endomicrobium sp.]|jgi:5-formyltetrahydrofolate cyclo-ligase|nr:5-formyltetrahydrofolate cyclo-ligase [Endomicrobium sp.]